MLQGTWFQDFRIGELWMLLPGEGRMAEGSSFHLGEWSGDQKIPDWWEWTWARESKFKSVDPKFKATYQQKCWVMKEDKNILKQSSGSECSYPTSQVSYVINVRRLTDGGVGELVAQIGGLLARGNPSPKQPIKGAGLQRECPSKGLHFLSLAIPLNGIWQLGISLVHRVGWASEFKVVPIA